MTGFGLYFVIVQIFGICATLYFAGQGRVVHERGTLLVSAVWSSFNLFGIIYWGTGLGVS